MFKVIKIHDDFFTTSFDTKEISLNLDLPQIKLPIYSLFCAPNRVYSVNFESNFKLSDNMSVDIKDSDGIISDCVVKKTSNTTGIVSIIVNSRDSKGFSESQIKIKDGDTFASMSIRAGYNNCGMFACDSISFNKTTGVISFVTQARGLPGGNASYWYVAEPDFTITDSNGNKMNATISTNLNCFGQVLLNRTNASYVAHTVTAILNESYSGNVNCTWTDKISGGVAQNYVNVNYLKP